MTELSNEWLDLLCLKTILIVEKYYNLKCWDGFW